MSGPTKLLSEIEASAILNISVRSIRKLRQSGELSYIRIGGSIRYHSIDLDNFIDERRMRCASTNVKNHRFGGSMSPSKVNDIEEARKKRANEPQR